jgi:hypothetical protein
VTNRLFRLCVVLEHPLAPEFCDTKPYPECADCTEELWPAVDPDEIDDSDDTP